jgi:Tol biopolymer transport system component
MSPEQARGKEVDRRADIWAFGCVLYEMLTGRQAFPTGRTVSDTIAAILVREPEWAALPAGTPPRVRAVLERCLRKDERRRWGDIADVRVELEDAGEETAPAAAVKPAPRSSRLREAAVVLSFLAAAVSVLWLVLAPVPEALPLRLELIAPFDAFNSTHAELSPDGRRLAFIGPNADGKRLIWVRPLDGTAYELPSTDGAGPEIFWSADSAFIGFSADGKLKKVAASGGPAQVVATLRPGGAYAGTWNAAGQILIGAESIPDGPLLRVPDGGGSLEPASELDTARKESAHGFPFFLPDGRHYFFLARSSDAQSPLAAYVGELDSKDRRPLPGIASEVKYSPTGHAVFIRDGALMAQPFDPDSLELGGQAAPVAAALVPAAAISGHFSVAANDSLAFFRGTGDNVAGVQNTQLVWFDRNGTREKPAGPEGIYNGPELSPDERYVAFSRNNDIWRLDLEKNLAEQITTDPAEDRNPRWSKDGKTLAFVSMREGGSNLYTRAVGVVAQDVLLLKDSTPKSLFDWSRDGKYLVYTAEGDVWAVAVPASGDPKAEVKPERVTTTEATELTPRISPDGRWIAYVSNESAGENNVYIQSFPGPGLKLKVSTNGGTLPRWSSDGSELYFYNTTPPGWWGVSVKVSGADLTTTPPARTIARSFPGPNAFNVSKAGRFLLQVGGGAAGGRGNFNVPTPAHAVVLVHWAKGR